MIYFSINQSIKPMKFIFTICTIAFLSTSYAQITVEDEVLHFATGAVISGVTYSLVYSKTQNKKKAFWYSLGLSTLAGLSKEILDSSSIIDGYFDTGEFIATAAGGLVASYSFNIFTGRNKKKKIQDGLVFIN